MQSRAVRMEEPDLLRRYQTLLEVGEVIHAFRDIDELFHNLAELLRRVIQCDGIAVGLLDESKQAISLRLAENWGAFPPEIGRSVPLSAIPGSVDRKSTRLNSSHG